MAHHDIGRFHKAKVECPHGHAYTPDNIYWQGPDRSWRKCKACDTARRTRQRQLSPVLIAAAGQAS